MKSTTLLSTALLLFASALSHPATVTAAEAEPEVLSEWDGSRVRPEAVRAHVEFLADDLLQGREPGTDGYRIAALYVATQFLALGLEPAGDDGSYLHRVPLASSVLDPESLVFRVEGPDGVKELAYRDDYLTYPSHSEDEVSVTAPVVFVGYGVEAPEFGRNDYEGVDVRGKIVAMFGSTPPGFPSEEGAHYAGSVTRAETAERHGAIGTIKLYDDRVEKRSPWERSARLADPTETKMTWVDENGAPFDPAPGVVAGVTLAPGSSEVLFAGAAKSYAEVRADSDAGREPGSFPLAVEVTLGQKVAHGRLESHNVAGMLPGSDPELRDEVVVLVGHLDHVGVGLEIDGDSIYNGALDNASGIATMIEAARAFVESGKPPRRSVMFLAVTAEEKGLRGADYFARNPTVPIESIVANVNLDMPILTYDFRDLVAFGAQHSTLEGLVADAAAKIGITLSPDPYPEQAIFIRSDHYRFVQQGVPAVMLSVGFANGGEAAIEDFRLNHYHQPSDETSLPIDYEAGARFALLNYLIARQIADADDRPQWHEGNFFGELYGR